MGDQGSGAATAIMFGVAAVLWFAYLIPTWLRRREYLATERNVTRLQQSLRIMVEAAEVPEEVRVEATARAVAQQERLLRERERQRAALEQAMLAKARAERAAAEIAARRVIQDEEHRLAELRRGVAAPAAGPDAGLLATANRVVRNSARRRRRARLATAAVLLIAAAAFTVQLVLVLSTGAVTGSWVVLGASALAFALAAGTLRTLARTPRTRSLAAPAAVAERESPELREFEFMPERNAREWTPVPVPQPLYAGTPEQQPVRPQLDAERLAREADEMVRRAVLAARRESAVVDFQLDPARSADEAPTIPAAPAAEERREASSWSRMGVLDGVDGEAPDLDEVLRRRRAS